MFQGETAITVDDKGRMAIPTAYRDEVARAGNRLVVTYNPYEAGCLWLYPEAEWQRVRDHVVALLSAKAGHGNLKSKRVGAATRGEPEGFERIVLPPTHRAAAGLEKKVVLLGMGGKFELWSEQAHAAQVQSTIGEDDVSDAMLELRL